MGFNGIGHFADLFGPSTTTAVEQLFQQQPFQLHQQQPQPRYEECCVPTGDCVVRSAPIRPDDPRAPDLYARVTCSDRGCPAGRYMHRECFDAWERLVLAYMKNAAAAAYSASTTVKDPWAAATNNNAAAAMNHQTAAYEMAYKACGCRCGRGYLKKDSDWPPAAGRRRSDDADSGVGSGRATVAASGGKKKKRRPVKPMPPLPMAATAVDCAELRLRAGSLSGGSSNGSSSPVTNSTAGSSVSPAHSGGSFGSGSSVAAGSSKRRMAAACPKDVFER